MEPGKETSSLSQTSRLPLALLGILVSFFAFCRGRRSRSHLPPNTLEQLNDPVQPKDGPNPAAKAQEGSPYRVIAEVYRSQSEINNAARREKRQDKRDNAKLLISTVTVVLTAVAGIIGLISAKAAQDAANAAKENAHATFEQAQIARQTSQANIDSFVLDQRAWIVAALEPHKWTNTPMSAVGYIAIRNNGKTPALHVVGHFVIAVIRPDEPLNFEYRGAYPVNIPVMMPNVEPPAFEYGVPFTRKLPSGLRGGIPWSEERRQEVMHMQLYVFAYGEITYGDIFTPKKHFVTYCQLMEGVFMTPAGREDIFRVPKLQKQCDDYNRIDVK